MFVVDAAILLPHSPRAVGRVVGRLPLLPRWCAGLRRVRFPVPERAAAPGCVFTYAAADVRLTLLARTLGPAGTPAPPDDPRSAAGAGDVVTHTAAGDGITLVWTLSAEPPDNAAEPTAARPPAATRLRARVQVLVDPEHPVAAARAALCRTVARRVPADLERLRALLARRQAERAAGAPPA
jgi:hypothetical protein